MDYEEPTLASLIFDLFKEIFGWIGSDFGGGAALGLVIIVTLVVAWRSKGIIGWVALGFLTLITLSAMMNKGCSSVGEALAWICFFGGLGSAVVGSLIAIITGQYWKIKTKLITGGVGMVLGVIVSAVAG